MSKFCPQIPITDASYHMTGVCQRPVTHVKAIFYA